MSEKLFNNYVPTLNELPCKSISGEFRYVEDVRSWYLNLDGHKWVRLGETLNATKYYNTKNRSFWKELECQLQ